jgi:ADP-heptose:LPS heptosyltransferase
VLKRLARRIYASALAVPLRAVAAVERARPGHTAGYDPRAVRRILVLRLPGLLGDAALLTPALRLLKDAFPAAEVHVLASPAQAPLLAPLSFIDRVVVWSAGDLLEPRQALTPAAWRAAAAAVRRLRRGRYDVALACYGRLSSALALLSGAPYRFGYAAEAFPGTLTHPLPGGRYDRPWHEADYNVALARAAGAAGETPPMHLVVPDESRRAVDALFRDLAAPASPAPPVASPGGSDSSPLVAPHPRAAPPIQNPKSGNPRQRVIQNRSPLVVLHPGATNGAAKRWPPGYWAALASRLGADGDTVVLVGGPQDRWLTSWIAARAAPRPVDLAGHTSLLQLLAVLERAAVVVSGDSGPVHFAVGLRRPVVAIHGPTDPAISGPYDLRRARVVRHALPCSPCYRLDRVADCPLGHALCQRLIAPAAVYAAVRALVGRGEPDVAADEADEGRRTKDE